MRNKWKSVIAYLIYTIHLGALIYFGIKDSFRILEKTYQNIYLGIILIGAVIYFSAYFKLGVKKSSGFGVDYSGLINSGVYKYVRHPQLLGWVTILVGISLYLNSLISLILTFFLWFLFKMLIQPNEEKQLIEKYGNEYIRYKRKTRSGI